MDPIKTGNFIAQLRREKGLTQEALRNRLGVTNKTISRWENGNYMPDIEMFQVLSEQFGVSINELLSGRRLNENAFRAEADRNIIDISKAGAFSKKEQAAFWKRKWLKEHISLVLFWLALFVAFCVYVYVKKHLIFIALTPFAAIGIYGVLRNKMMIYIEAKLYDPEVNPKS